MILRQRRVERRRGVRVVLGQRDEALLRGLARFRIARTSDLLALFFSRIRRDTAMARLRKLLDGGYVHVEVSSLSEENMYALGSAGRAWLEAQGLASTLPPKGGRDHHLAVIRVWTRLAAALHGRAGLLLHSFIPDWELRQHLAGTAPAVVADALVEIQRSFGSNSTMVRLSVEVDLGTERRGALERKLAAYQLIATEEPRGDSGLAVVLVGAGVRRRQAVTALVERLWPSWWLVCAIEEWPQALLRRLSVLHQTPLTTSPDGQETSPTGTDSLAEEFELPGDEPSRYSSDGGRSET